VRWHLPPLEWHFPSHPDSVTGDPMTYVVMFIFFNLFVIWVRWVFKFFNRRRSTLRRAIAIASTMVGIFVSCAGMVESISLWQMIVVPKFYPEWFYPERRALKSQSEDAAPSRSLQTIRPTAGSGTPSPDAVSKQCPSEVGLFTLTQCLHALKNRSSDSQRLDP
jgi:hypothetical protein